MKANARKHRLHTAVPRKLQGLRGGCQAGSLAGLFNGLLASVLLTGVSGGLCSLQAQADPLAFSPVFQDQMVLQRGAVTRIGGQGQAGETVTVRFGEQKVQAKVGANNAWAAELKGLKAAGPKPLQVSDADETVTLEGVMVGEVWVFAGQSNMQMGLDEVDGGPKAIASADPAWPVRVLIVPKEAADAPRKQLHASWQPASSESLKKFTAVGWFFAERLREDPSLANVPMGLIDCSFGGTTVEGWTPEGKLPAALPKDQITDSIFGIKAHRLYNGMVVPIADTTIRGVVWYQGESNGGRPQWYEVLLSNMIEQWRQTWDQKDLPFYLVQLPAFEGRMGPFDFSWIREAQAQVAAKAPNVSVAITYDTTDGYDLHPREKAEIGRRAGLLALKHTYGQNVVADSPTFQSVKQEGDALVVALDQLVQVPTGESVQGFAIAGQDGAYFYANGSIDGNQVRLAAEQVPDPHTVRFAWGPLPVANVTNRAGLPLAPFRTDALQPETLTFQPLPRVYRMEAPAFTIETGRGGSIASVVVAGKQFMSNEPDGGTFIPNMFGPRNLAYVDVLGPQHVRLADGQVALEVGLTKQAMDWTLKSKDGGQMAFHIGLKPDVQVTLKGNQATLVRGSTKLTVGNVDQLTDRNQLVVTVPPHGTVNVPWRVVPR